MNKYFAMFKTPSADQAARDQLAKAKRDLLTADAHSEQAALVATYQRGLIERLKREIASGELL